MASATPRTRHAQAAARTDFEQKWTGLRRPVRADAGVRGRARGETELPLASPFLTPHHAAFVKAALLALFAAGLELVVPIFTQIVVDDALPHHDRSLLFVL